MCILTVEPFCSRRSGLPLDWHDMSTHCVNYWLPSVSRRISPFPTQNMMPVSQVVALIVRFLLSALNHLAPFCRSHRKRCTGSRLRYQQQFRRCFNRCCTNYLSLGHTT
ncbi:hypothetical protein O9992_28195 [Vibrio lentus]|nr:hypothetical protein [Vibrio lentus]